MPLNVAKLIGKTVPATIRVKVPGEEGDGEEMAVVYKPGVLTAEWENELRTYGERGEGWAALVSKLIVSWDLLGEDGKPVALEYVPAKPAAKKDEAGTPASGALLKLPTWLLQAVVAGVRGDVSPNSKPDETTGASS